MLKENFAHVTRVDYGSKLSMSIEAFFNHRTGYERGIGFMFLVFAISVSWVLSFFEGIVKNDCPAYSVYMCTYKGSVDLPSESTVLSLLN